jgi:hypothetical protein
MKELVGAGLSAAELVKANWQNHKTLGAITAKSNAFREIIFISQLDFSAHEEPVQMWGSSAIARTSREQSRPLPERTAKNDRAVGRGQLV